MKERSRKWWNEILKEDKCYLVEDMTGHERLELTEDYGFDLEGAYVLVALTGEEFVLLHDLLLRSRKEMTNARKGISVAEYEELEQLFKSEGGFVDWTSPCLTRELVTLIFDAIREGYVSSEPLTEAYYWEGGE